jgi:hypothetical protein
VISLKVTSVKLIALVVSLTSQRIKSEIQNRNGIRQPVGYLSDHFGNNPFT